LKAREGTLTEGFEMVRRAGAPALLSLIMALTACSAVGTPSQPPAAGASAIKPDKDCGSAGGVKVAPCPVRLGKHTKSGVVVTVSGHGVVNSYLGSLNGCFNGYLCYNAERYGSSQTQWLITSGSSCGAADVQFMGVDSHGNVVGYFFLKVSNHYCP
jgi:hypothetical protein